ncbi:MAG: GNAT family N-acetyltransferase [Gemmatimonadaceae bacterium]|nr:GNAT family N-acetyltransferase [Gemmatimonadaceae bacterium]
MRTDPVEVVDYDPAWPVHFAQLARRARAALGDLPARIEHVGSTAVPGLAAKPVIDLDVVVAPDDVTHALERLASLGYVAEGDKGIPGREAMRWPPGEPRHHLYVCADDARALDAHLVLRTALRADPAMTAEYAALKRSLAARFPHEREAYLAGKDDFIARVLAAHGSRVHVRRATPRDVIALSHLGRTTYPAYFADVWSPAGLAAYVEREYGEDALRSQLGTRDLTWWIADDGAALVGYAKVRHDRPVPGLGAPGVELDKCYVAPGQTGRGIGARLLSAVTGQARMFAPRRLWLGVLTTNVAAQRMYAREGFTALGQMPLATDLREIGCVVMARPMETDGA